MSTSSTFASYVTGYQDLDMGNVTSRAVSGLSASTTYCYRLRAYNSGGTSANSATISVTTLPNPPSAPTVSAASGITSLGFTANWSTTSGATGYRLDVSTSSTFASFVGGFLDLDLGTVTSLAVSGLNAGTTYYYRVRAYNSGGTSANSSTMIATTALRIALRVAVAVAAFLFAERLLSWLAKDLASKRALNKSATAAKPGS